MVCNSVLMARLTPSSLEDKKKKIYGSFPSSPSSVSKSRHLRLDSNSFLPLQGTKRMELPNPPADNTKLDDRIDNKNDRGARPSECKEK